MAQLGTIRGALLALLLVAVSAAGAEPKRVLILDSFGRDVAPFSEVAAAFRTTLVQQLNHSVDLYETSLDLAQFGAPEAEGAFADFLAQRFAKRRFELIVTIGAPAANFAARRRERLFPRIPMLFVGVDQRLLPPEFLSTNSTVVTENVNLPGIVENILQILPKTKNIVVAIGNSPLERFWLAELRREFEPFTRRVRFTWFNQLSLEEMERRAAALPAHSVILFGFLVLDAAGAIYDHYQALKRLHAAANAPIFGYFESQLGLGILGGRLYQDRAVGVRAARAAIRILRGEAPAAIAPQFLATAWPRYDWRELQRWDIDEARLPPRSEVLYRAPSFWVHYKWYVIAATTVCLAQALFILALLLNRRRLRLAQSDLRESEQRMRLAAEATKLGLWVWDIRDNAVWASGSGRVLFGLSPTQPINFERFLELLHPDDRESTRQAIQCSLEGDGHYGAEYRIVLPERGTRWIATRGRVEFDSDGKPTRLLSVSIDITEPKRAQEKFRLAVESSPSAIVMVDDRDQIVLMNARAESLFGYTRQELIGRPIEILVPNRLRGDYAAYHTQFFASPQLQYLGVGRDLLARRKDGTEFEVEIELNPLDTEDGVHVLAAIVDITERKRAELEAQRHRQELAHVSRVSAMGELTASIAHELNQPLTAILSNAQAAQRLLARPQSDLQEIKDILQDIVSDDKRAGEIIRRIRALVRKDVRERERVCINRVIQEVIKFLYDEALLRNVRIGTHLERGLPAVSGDPIQLQQVLINLYMNAFDAMAENRTHSRELMVCSKTAHSGRILVTVTDSGSGLPADRLEEIFQPFYSSKQQGLGMGLAVSRTLIEAHGGRMWAANNRPRGAKICIELPAQTMDKNRVSRDIPAPFRTREFGSY